jgi:hypothetical protein
MLTVNFLIANLYMIAEAKSASPNPLANLFFVCRPVAAVRGGGAASELLLQSNSHVNFSMRFHPFSSAKVPVEIWYLFLRPKTNAFSKIQWFLT